MDRAFDVFLSHNSQDKQAVIELAEALRQRGVDPWLDIWEAQPGRPWLKILEEVIEVIPAALIVVGKDGQGPWQAQETRAALIQLAKRDLPIIPVLLPGSPIKPDLPLFLQGFTWVDFRTHIGGEELDRLVWGITGEKPGRKKSPISNTPAPPKPAKPLLRPTLQRLRDWTKTFLQPETDYSGEKDLATYRHFLTELTQVAVGRTQELEDTLQWVTAAPSCRILVEGLSGFGKTTFFAQLKDALEERQCPIAWHIFSRNFYRDPTEDSRRFDVNITEQLAWHEGRNIHSIRNRSSYVIDTLSSPPPGLILLIDALDETDSRFLVSRLPPTLNNGLKVVVTSRKMGNDLAIEGAGLNRDELDRIVEIPPLSVQDISELLAKMKAPAGDPKRIFEITQGDPFFVRFLVKDIAEGRVQNLDGRRPPSLEKYLDEQFDQLTEAASLVQAKILTQIVMSPGPIPQTELISTIDELNPVNFRSYFRPISRFFIATNRGYIVCHNRFREFFAERLGMEMDWH